MDESRECNALTDPIDELAVTLPSTSISVETTPRLLKRLHDQSTSTMLKLLPSLSADQLDGHLAAEPFDQGTDGQIYSATMSPWPPEMATHFAQCSRARDGPSLRCQEARQLEQNDVRMLRSSAWLADRLTGQI